MNIHVVARGMLAAALLLLAACSAAPQGGVERIEKATLGTGETISLPHQWPGGRLGETEVELVFRVAHPHEAIGVHFGPTTLGFRARVNGKFAFQVGDGFDPTPNIYSFRATPTFVVPGDMTVLGTNRLTLELFPPVDGGSAELGKVYVGSADAIDDFALRRLLGLHVGPTAIGVVLAMVGVVSLGLWRGRRDSQLFLLLALGSLVWALQLLLLQWPVRLLPRPHWSVFVNACYAWIATLIGVFFLRFAYRSRPLLERFAFVIAAGAAPLLYLGHALEIHSATSIAMRVAVLVFISIALVALVRHALQLRNVTGYALVSMAAVCVGIAFRDFFVSMLPHPEEWIDLNPYSGVALVLFAGWMLLERYHKAYSDFEMLNRDLERRVADANVELHRRLEQVEAARATAEQANVAKSRFFAAASHDLRQPLHSLGLFASALRDVVGSSDGRDLVRRISDAIGALNRLFDELLDISRLEAGTVEVRRRNIALQPLFDRLDDEFHAEAAAKGLRLRFHPTALAVYTDATLLERILANLVSNAVRYTRTGGILVGARRRGGTLQLQVCDTGVGVAPEQRALIFEEFYQAANPGRDPKQGLGLGLAIVRRLTTLLDLPLALDSTVGRGTRFVLTLPPANGPVEPLASEEQLVADQPLAGRRALVLDDDAAICEATVGLLRRWGAQAQSANTVDAALACVRAGFAPDVILADLRLAEDTDGIRAVERLRAALGHDVPALLISGDTGARELVRVKESGLTLLTKPVPPARLRSALTALLGVAQAQV